MKLKKQARQIAESLLICIALCTLPFLPRSWILCLARSLGKAAFRLSASLRKIAMANLEVAFGNTISTAEKEAIAKESFQTFALVMIDLFWFGVFSKKRIMSYVKMDSSCRFYFETKPAVAVTGHIGNWEILGQAVSVQDSPLVSVAAPLENRFVNSILNRARRTTGQKVVAKEGALKTLLKTLKNGERVALVMDQNVLPEEGGEFTNFFGLQAPFSKAASTLSQRTGADVVFMFCVVDKDGDGYTAYCIPPLRARGPDAESRDITQEIAKTLEQEIRKHAGQWLWMYKRWKYVPSGESIEDYPFYSRAGGKR